MQKSSSTGQHYMSPKLALITFPQKGGYAIQATEFITKGDLLIFWGGDIVTGEQLEQLDPYTQTHGIQVEENLFQIPSGEPHSADFINHSCEPNAGLDSPISLRALRDIEAGEEVCFDYATCDSKPYDEFECACGTPSCRGVVTGDDWKLPELQHRYDGYFSPYLQRRIDKMHADEYWPEATPMGTH